MAEEQSTLKMLELSYEEVVRESGRLRDARGAFSRQLGPLPLAGGVVLGIFSAFTHHPHQARTWVAFGLFGLSVIISMVASGLAPYRRLRAGHIDPGDASGSDGGWLRERIELERKLYGPLSPRPSRGALLRPWSSRTLQEAFEVERYAVLLVQLLFIAEIGLLCSFIAS